MRNEVLFTSETLGEQVSSIPEEEDRILQKPGYWRTIGRSESMSVKAKDSHYMRKLLT